MKRNLLLCLAVLMAASILFTACKPTDSSSGSSSSGAASAADASEGSGSDAESGGELSFASFTAEDLDGNEVTEAIFADHELTMLNIWATDCPPCISEMPELAEINREYADKGVQVVGVVMDLLDSDRNISEDQLDLAKEIVEQTGADYPHLRPSDDLIIIALQYVTATPATVFIDKDGNYVGNALYGARDKAKWGKVIDEKLAELKQ